MNFEEMYGAPNDHTAFLGMDARIVDALEALGLVATVQTRYVYGGRDGEMELRGEPIWDITAKPKPQTSGLIGPEAVPFP